MEHNNNTTAKLLVIAKQWTQGLGHCFQSFVKCFPGGKYTVVLFYLISYSQMKPMNFFHTDFFKKIP